MGVGGGLVVIDFSQAGNSAYFRGAGWSGQEPDRVWAVGPRSLIRIPIQSSGWPMMLEVEIDPCRETGVVEGQIARVQVNGVQIGWVRMDRPAMIRCEIDPAIATADGILDVEFGFPGFLRRDLMSDSRDDRPLSGSFSFARIYTMDLFKPGPHFPTSSPDIAVIGLTPPFPPAPPAESRLASAVYTFGSGGTGVPYLRSGWGLGAGHLAWIVAPSAQMALPAPTLPGPYVLRVDLTPVDIPDKEQTRLTLLLDRIVIGQFMLDEPTTWVVHLPRELTEGRNTLPLNFIPWSGGPRNEDGEAGGDPVNAWNQGVAVGKIEILPLPPVLSPEIVRTDEASRPVPVATSARFLSEDAAALPEAIAAALGTDIVTLARGFESLGHDREFGVIQRKLGVDAVNLFRFGKISPANLFRALADDLNAIDDPEAVAIELNDAEPRQFVATVPAYEISWPTFRKEDEVDERTVWRDHSTGLRYLRRKFYEGLRDGRKIYVLKHNHRIPFGQAAALLMELTRHGPAKLLCVEPASRGRRPGEVELLMPGLLRGYVGRFAPDTDIDGADPTDWLRVMANAALLNGAAAAAEDN